MVGLVYLVYSIVAAMVVYSSNSGRTSIIIIFDFQSKDQNFICFYKNFSVKNI